MSGSPETGEGISPMAILYQNSQWSVTKSGIEARRPESYFIEADRLDETTDRDQVYYDWPVHLAEKDWVNLNLFGDAFLKAAEMLKTKYVGPFDRGMFDRSMKYAWKVRSGG
jgi:hypothetical protein